MSTITIIGGHGEVATQKITVAGDAETRDLDVPSTSRDNLAHVIAATIAEPASFGTTLNFHDGDTPIAEAATQGS